jgi:hypothetical protein
VEYLRDGDKFIMPGLDLVKDTEVVRVGSGSVLIRGKKREDIKSESWTPFEHTVSCATPAIYLAPGETFTAEPVEHEAKEEKQSKRKKKMDTNQTQTDTNVTETATPKVKGKRGRKIKCFKLDFPEGSWTKAEIAAKNNCTPQDVINYLKRNGISYKETGFAEKTGQRGKPAIVYRLA